MSASILQQTITRIAEHVTANKLQSISMVLHGGEPLLAGLDFLETVFIGAKQGIPCEVAIGMQSNLTLVTEETINLFDHFGATLAGSLDGPRIANDRYRVYHSGRSSFDETVCALNLISRSENGRRVLSGLLAVIDIENDPLDVYKFLSEFRPPTLDFLLPDATHDVYPSGKTSFRHTPYADWLIRLFDFWFDNADLYVPVRCFEDIIGLLLNGKAGTENIGTGPVDLIVVETDGTIEGVDTLKVAYPGAPNLGLDVFNHSFDDVKYHPAILARMDWKNALSEQCLCCRLVDACGGGYFPHRYGRGRRFGNPSVYCHDLAKLIMHIRSRLLSELPPMSGPDAGAKNVPTGHPC